MAEPDGAMEGGEPARGYSWPPFEIGNDAAVTHGAYSSAKWRPLAERLDRELVGLLRWARSAVHAPVRADYCRAEAQLFLVSSYLNEVGLLDGEGVPLPATTLQAQLVREVAVLRQQLGIGPLNLAKLLQVMGSIEGDATPDGLDELLAEGRQVLEARAEDETEKGGGGEVDGVS